MSRDDSKNIFRIFNDYKNEVNLAVQFDNDKNYFEALNHYQKAFEISTQIANFPQTSYIVAIKQKNGDVQQRICELKNIQQQNFPNQNQLNHVQCPQKPIAAQQNNLNQHEDPQKVEPPNQFQNNFNINYQNCEMANQDQYQQPQYENTPKPEIPVQVQAKPYSPIYVMNNPIQNQLKPYDNPPRTEVPNAFQKNNLYNHLKYDFQNQPKPYENPPKTEVPNAFQQIPLSNFPNHDILNQDQNQIQIKQYENPPKTEIPNQNQQRPFYNYPKYEKINQNQNQPKIIENPPKSQIPNQSPQSPYFFPQKPEITNQNQPKQYENPPKSDIQNPNIQKSSKKSSKYLDPNRRVSKNQKHRLSTSPPNSSNSSLLQNPNSKKPLLRSQYKNGNRQKTPSLSKDDDEVGLQPKKSSVMELIKTTSSDSSDIMPPSMIIVNKNRKKQKRSSSPPNSPTKSSSVEYNPSDQGSQIAKKRINPKRSESTQTVKKNKQPKPPLLSNIVVQYDMFNFERDIGNGSFGKVSLVTDKSSGAKYALKEITNPIINRLSEIQLLREIELMNFARHPLVCHLRGFSLFGQSASGNRFPFIVTDYYPNGSLGAVVSGKRKFNPTQKLIVLYGIAHAMSFLHSLGITHRDLKPDNVLLNQNDYPIVCDFGLSKLMEMPKLRQTSAAGSPVYMAPELMKRQEYTNSIDVYAYSYICFELLTETMAFEDVKDVYTLVNLVCNDKKRPQMNGFSEAVLPKEFKRLISKGWSDTPEERPSFKNILSYFRKGILRIPGVDEDKFKNFMLSISKL